MRVLFVSSKFNYKGRSKKFYLFDQCFAGKWIQGKLEGKVTCTNSFISEGQMKDGKFIIEKIALNVHDQQAILNRLPNSPFTPVGNTSSMPLNQNIQPLMVPRRPTLASSSLNNPHSSSSSSSVVSVQTSIENSHPCKKYRISPTDCH